MLLVDNEKKMKYDEIIKKGYVSINSLHKSTGINRKTLTNYKEGKTKPDNDRAILIYESLLDVKTIKLPDISELF